MDIDNNNQNEQTTLLNKLIYAIDEHGMEADLFLFIINKFFTFKIITGIGHLFDNGTFDELKTISLSTEEKMDISQSIVVFSNPIDQSLPLTNEDLKQSISN